MIYSLRRQQAVVALGFGLVAAAWLAYAAEAWSNSPPGQRGAELVFGLGSIAGYLVLAAAEWSWLRWIDRSDVVLSDMSQLLRLFALGNLLLSVGVLALGYNAAHLFLNEPYEGHSEIAILASYWLQFLGLLLVSAAYWSTSSLVRRLSREVRNSEPDPQLV